MIDIDREHPDYHERKNALRMFRDLYVGGQQFKKHVGEYLLKRQKEPLDVYAERLHRAFYQNYIGSIIDWYAATLFRRAPSVQFEGGLLSGQDFLSQFVDDCDESGTTLSSFFRDCFTDMLVAGQSHILIDFPRSGFTASNRAEEDASGLSRAYVVHYKAEELINWSRDGHREYNWVVLRSEVVHQASVESATTIKETVWHYYDRQRVKIYRRVESAEVASSIEQIYEGFHGLCRQNRVPLLTLEVSEGLWLMNKACHLQLEHFNKSNALSWAITMGLFAMPVIYSDREWNQIVGESYYVQLGPQDKFGWAEPDGKVYQIAASNLESLKDEIYRVCYLSQAAGEVSGGHAQSAASKQMDFRITEEVLRSYAVSVKDCMRKLLKAVSDAREDGVLATVTGLDEVDITDLGTELDDASKLLQLGIQSPTLNKQIYQRLALKYLSDARQETKDQVAREIEAQVMS